MPELSPFRLMYTMFGGLSISLGYGLSAGLLIYSLQDYANAVLFFETYAASFNTLVSLGLILGTAIIVGRTQAIIPKTIETVFKPEQLERTEYSFYRSRFYDRQRSIIWSSELALAAFLIFLVCKFPLPLLGENLMIIAACAEYAFAVYVGRKLFYGGLMLHSLIRINVTRNLFKKHELDEINSYVNIAATLALLFVFVHTRSYYNGPFSFEGPIGESARTFLATLSILMTPVLLIFNFYPRIVLKKIYSQSIDVEIRNVRRRLRKKDVSDFERMSYLIEFDKQARDELRYRLRLTLSDLPIGITIMIMVLGSLLRG